MLNNDQLRAIVTHFLPCGISSETMRTGTPETDNDQMVSVYPHQLMAMARTIRDETTAAIVTAIKNPE